MKKLISSLAIASLITFVQLLPSLAEREGPGNMGGNYNHTYICTNNGNGKLNLRKGPSQGFGVVLQIPNGSKVNQIDSTTSSDGFVWHKINYRGAIGWVRGDFLCQ
jgi:uncharacterized protein YraI